jgi:integrase/recombinase XerD
LATAVVAVDPSEKVAYCRKGDALPKSILSLEEMKKLLAAPDVHTHFGFRDRVVLELLYSTGLRLRELCSLDVEDVDLADGFVRVRHGKGDRERVTPLGTLAGELVQSYLAEVRPKLLAARKDSFAEQALILSQYGERLGPGGIAKLISRHVAAVGLKVHVTPHSFRHTCATHMLRGGANLRHLQEMLGHRRVTSTEVYTRITITELREAHAKFHPRGSVDEVEVRPPRPRGRQ